ncbi:DUF1963 domain-containing protein [Nocardia fusca]
MTLGGWASEMQRNHDRGILPGSRAEQRLHPDEPPYGKLLLTQFDTDHTLGMGWGDFGMLYTFIDPEDWTAGDFDRVQTYWDCH